MNLVYTKAITKDVRKIKDQKTKNAVLEIIQNIKKASTLKEVPSLKKMSGHPSAYRIRIGIYRMGLYFEDDTVILARFLKRNDIYKVFP
ncbi:type II toxin-antitoxin system RelE family toxin [Marixanthomonas spongiae]|uniref:Plasmid stabilization protein n=1 Tax=Marixanthomonas spongiae TaxID=2174845 RepID=A0A2U0I860_9FLAO|nr:plasmid stabilization protein [Marixanthomonas spongiae]PVW17292.1 plasmid stabilization protein [Marixanthomonas spongiae]